MHKGVRYRVSSLAQEKFVAPGEHLCGGEAGFWQERVRRTALQGVTLLSHHRVSEMRRVSIQMWWRVSESSRRRTQSLSRERENPHVGMCPSVWFGRLTIFTWDATFLLRFECIFPGHLFYLFIKNLQHKWKPQFPLQVHPSQL